MLLTSSQVSMALSSAIVVTFTGMLFLAGYILQQQSLHILQSAIRPQIPSPRHHHNSFSASTPANPQSRLSRPFGRLKDQLHFRDDSVNWSKLAHAQLVKSHDDVCHAMIVFHELSKSKSPVPRLLLFPRSWVKERSAVEDQVGDGEIINIMTDPALETTLRLLRKASRRYRVVLVPIGPLSEGANETDATQYSLASLFSLTKYDRVMTLPTPGLMLNSRHLDSLLAFYDSEYGSLSAFPPLNVSTTQSSMMVVKPSKDVFKRLSDIFAHSLVSSDTELFNSAFPSSTSPNSLEDDDAADYDSFGRAIFTTSRDMRAPRPSEDPFNATDFLSSTAFIKLEDDGLPGPQYDIPYQTIVKLRPEDEDQSFLWEKMYNTYKDRRYGVCGLDLEAFPITTES